MLTTWKCPKCSRSIEAIDLDSIHVRRSNPVAVDITFRAYDGIFDVQITGSCSCGRENCGHLASVLAWCIPARPTVEATEASPMPEAAGDGE
jgi:hypothetical protein